MFPSRKCGVMSQAGIFSSAGLSITGAYFTSIPGIIENAAADGKNVPKSEFIQSSFGH